MADILKATLYAASGEAHTLTPSGDGSAAAVQGTQANLKDANDATGSSATATWSGAAAESLTYREEWAIDTASVTGTISFIRIIARHAMTNTGSGGGSASYQPSINGITRGSNIGSGAVASNSQDFATDPADSSAWTNAKLNAQKFGWFLTAGNDPDVGMSGDTTKEAVPEFRIEVWGPAPSTNQRRGLLGVG